MKVHWRWLCLTVKELLQQRWQQNWIFILKTLFPQKQSVESFTNPTSMVVLQLLNIWLLTTTKGWKRWWDNHKTWMFNDWKYIIWSDESPFTLFPTSGRIYVWRMSKEAYNPEYLVPTVKHGGGSVMMWAATSCCSAGPEITLNGWITASDYVGLGILGNQVHPVVQMFFPNNDAIFQDDSLPIYTSRSVQSWRTMKVHFSIFPGQHNHQT